MSSLRLLVCDLTPLRTALCRAATNGRIRCNLTRLILSKKIGMELMARGVSLTTISGICVTRDAQTGQRDAWQRFHRQRW